VAYISIPKLGMTMQDALLVEWKVNEGDHVDAGQIVLVIETAKTQWEVERRQRVTCISSFRRMSGRTWRVWWGSSRRRKRNSPRSRPNRAGDLYDGDGGFTGGWCCCRAGRSRCRGRRPASEGGGEGARPDFPGGEEDGEEHMIDVTP